MQSPWQTGNKTAKPPEYLPAYESRHLISANLGLNSFLFHGFPSEIGLTKKDEEVRTEEVATHEQSIPQRKKFFIFDRSGSETRMMFGSLKPQIPNPAAKTVSEYNSEQACGVVNDSYEDRVIGEDSEYHEDTEELNALLYSDNDDTSNDCVDEDEVSTGRSPDLDNGSDDEVTSWARPLKRQKPLPSMATKPTEELSPQLCEDDKLSVRDKIRSKLSVLENLVPGSKGKDPLVILEETIQYLKYFKANNPLNMEEDRRGSCL